MTIYEMIRKPIITEKSELLRREFNKYTFEVDKRVNKLEIKNAVEKIFGVTVESVATITSKPKTKRHGMKLYKTPLKKKAIVKLKDGDNIKYFEGV
ncbi:50S ribosomal protein L23 [Haliovirga abyssi]|uniref:Large ribosomal subunit protein uL23 n=1 Tax=Haliovirga abyssi TaxID=2996794 RepID=A0AAU9D8E8_9FUSO|nr:50S ribosomal protein L23 [Haliovirga abyssi]BDU49525.1 50S ribosomal protein L23 [Haliovirga abyssi]